MQPQIGPSIRCRQSPSPFLCRVIGILSMNAEQLLNHIEDMMLSNPVLEYPDDRGEHEELINSIPDRRGGLEEWLLFQLHTSGAAGTVASIAEYLIGNVNCAGYLEIDLENVARDLHCRADATQAALTLLQSLDPPGVGARNLSECLELQLKRQNDPDPCALEIVRTQLERIPRNKVCLPQYDERRIQQAVACIKALDPKPGLQYCANKPTAYTAPDVRITTTESGAVEVELMNQPATPVISAFYHEYGANENQEVGDYLRQHLKMADDLLLSINERKKLLLSISMMIAKRQQDYFLFNEALAPLSMCELAEALHIHVSTVSRVLSGKFVLFHNRVFPMKELCPPKLSSGQSGDQIKRMILRLIDLESKADPLSDAQISSCLLEKGVSISRRTVSKYRQEMGQPQIAQRKV